MKTTSKKTSNWAVARSDAQTTTPFGAAQARARHPGAASASCRPRVSMWGMNGAVGLVLLGLAASACTTATGPRSRAVNASGEAMDPKTEAKTRFESLALQLAALKTDEVVDELWLNKELEDIVSLDPDHLLARFNLAVLKERQGKAAEARDIYEDLLDEDKNFQPAAENLAAYYVSRGDAKKAIGIYRRIVRADRQNVTSRLALARLLANEGKYDESVELCRAALGSKGDSVEAYRLMATAYLSRGALDLAEVAIGRGLKIAKEDPELNLSLARVLVARGENFAGVSKMRSVVASHPDRLDARAHLANIAFNHGDCQTAMEQYQAILEASPEDPAARLGLAVCQARSGNPEGAESQYKKLLSDDSDNLDALWDLAVLYHRRLGRLDDAIEHYEKFRKKAPRNDPSQQKASEALNELKRIKAAAAAQSE